MKLHILWVLSLAAAIYCGCAKQHENINSLMLEIQPEGDSDFPRDTIDIFVKDFLNKKIKMSISQQFSLHRIVTDSATLTECINFFHNNVPSQHYSQAELVKFGSTNIRLLNRNKLIQSYSLNSSASVLYFEALLRILTDRKLDRKIIIEVKSQALEPINQ